MTAHPDPADDADDTTSGDTAPGETSGRAPGVAGGGHGPAAPTDDAAGLRHALADQIARDVRVPLDPRVDEALRTVSRHKYLPGVALPEAYAPRPVATRRPPDARPGSPARSPAVARSVSSASAPRFVAETLSLAGVEPGHRVLEVGTGTGFSAALIAWLAGPEGAVTTVELDRDLAALACGALAATGYPDVEVVTGDGAHGAASRAPFDRIVIATAMPDVPAPLWQQLRPDGRIVMPLQLHPSGLIRIIAAQRVHPGRRGVEELRSTTVLVGGFDPVHTPDGRPDPEFGDGPDRGSRLGLGPGVALVLGGHAHGEPDQLGQPGRGPAHAPALAEALRYPPHKLWSGVHVLSDAGPAEHLDLWLLAHLRDTGYEFARLTATGAARSRERAVPARRWNGPAFYIRDGSTLAYLRTRPITIGTHELGITAHGPLATVAAGDLVTLLRLWERHRPNDPRITLARVPPAPASPHTAAPPAPDERPSPQPTVPATSWPSSWRPPAGPGSPRSRHKLIALGARRSLEIDGIDSRIEVTWSRRG